MSTKNRKLLKLQSELAAKYGERAAMFVTDMPKGEYVSSGSLALDFALGTGGFPTNRAVEIAGFEGTGKTTLGLLAMANFIDAFPDKGAVILDLEHKLSNEWVEKLIGRERASKVILVWPDTIEQATDMYIQCCEGGLVSYVLLDSIGGAPTQRVFNKSAEIGNMGGNAIGVTRFAQFASVMSSKYNVCTVGVNQARDDMSGYQRHTTPGGRAWKHACVARIQMKQGKDKFYANIDGDKLQVGYSVVAKVVKNQMAAPYRVASWPFYNLETEEFGFGIDRLSEISRLSMAVGVVEQRGAWYYHDSLPDGKIKSQARLLDYLKDNKDFQDLLAKQTIDAVGDRGLNAVAPSGSQGDITDEDSDIVKTSTLHDIFLGEDMQSSGEENQVPEGEN